MAEFDYNGFLSKLKSLSKNETVEDLARHKAILNTKQEVIGISMAHIRTLAKDISKTNRESFLKLAESKLPEYSFYEETLIEGLVIANIKDLDYQVSKLKIWVEKIDNWATCDSVVTTMKLLKKSKNKDKYIDEFIFMAKSPKEFVSRFGVIVLMIDYLDEDHIDRIYGLIKEIKNDAYYVKMAIAWFISYGYLINKEKTIKLLNEKVLDKFIQNKAISKCRDSYRISQEDKDNLLLYRM